MLTKSQLQIERAPQRRATQELNNHFRPLKQQNSREQKPKNVPRNMPQLINSPSQRKIPINSNHPHQNSQIDPPSLSNSNASRPRNSQSFLGVDRVVQLHQRLKNLHLFYKTRIEQQKARTAQRNQVFIGIIEQMQRSHNEKLSQLSKLVQQSHNDKKDVGLVDERMNEIKGSIDEILKQSNDLKEGNQRLEREIEDKELVLKEKEEELAKLKEEVMDSRNQLESFQRLNLRENKRNKDILGMLEKTETNFGKKNSH